MLDRQLQTVDAIQHNPKHPYVLSFLQHPKVFTLGRGFSEEHLLRSTDFLQSEGVECLEVTRGGSVTYHGPGQLVVYVHVNLKEMKLSFSKLFRDLEEWVIDYLKIKGVQAGREPGMTGVWVEGTKICAMGLAASRFVTYHGISINLDMDMHAYGWSIPCGLHGKKVTSLKMLTGQSFSPEDCAYEMLGMLPEWLSQLPSV